MELISKYLENMENILLIRFSKWLQREGKDEKTIKAYSTVIKQFLQWQKETFNLELTDNITQRIVEEYLEYLEQAQNRKQSTINKTIASLKSFFQFLIENNTVRDNPMMRIKIRNKTMTTHTENEATKWLTKEEQEQFLDYVKKERNEFQRLRNLAIIDLMLYAGLRVSEVENLKIEDVKFNQGVSILIHDDSGKHEVVQLVPRFSTNLQDWIHYRNNTKLKNIDSNYLFVSERSDKFTARGIQVMLNKYARLANMQNITPHRFRHSFCKNLAVSGAPLEVIKKLARHESIQSTIIYMDPSQEMEWQALDRM